MILKDLHVHTVFSDGKNTPEEMVLAAIDKGMECIGFSDHSYALEDADFCVARENIPDYKKTINALKDKYKDKIQVLCGIEQDLYADEPAEGYDYVIGSVHRVKAEDTYVCVDHTADVLASGVGRYFGGDYYALAEAYFDALSQLADVEKIDVVGHFDLLTKFNEGGRFFDESHPRYVAAWQKAADRLLTKGVPFEINTGAISRGYRTQPYPAEPIREYIRKKGGSFILSSDGHKAENLCFGFEEWEKCL